MIKKKTIAAAILGGVYLTIYLIGVFSPQKITPSQPVANDYVYTAVSDGYSISKGPSFVGKGETYLPAEYNGQPVTEIAANGFADADLRVVYIPPSVKRIRDYAFKDNPLLVYMEIPDSVTTVGQRLFDGGYNYCTNIRIGGAHSPSRWYAISNLWRSYRVDNIETYSAGYSAGYKLSYEKTNELEIVYDTDLMDYARNVIKEVPAGTKIKNIREYLWDCVEIELEDGSIGRVYYDDVSILANRGVYIESVPSLNRVYLYPFFEDSSDVVNLEDLDAEHDWAPYAYRRLVAIEQREVVTQSRTERVPYYLIEYNEGEYAWVNYGFVSNERYHGKMTILPLFHPVRNLLVMARSPQLNFAVMMLFYTTPMIITLLMIRSIGNRLANKKKGLYLYLGLAGINLILMVFFAVTLNYASLIGEYALLMILFWLVLLVVAAALQLLLYWLYGYRYCYKCGHWDGYVYDQTTDREWEEHTTTTTTTTHADGYTSTNKQLSIARFAKETQHCKCPHCNNTWTQQLTVSK